VHTWIFTSISLKIQFPRDLRIVRDLRGIPNLGADGAGFLFELSSLNNNNQYRMRAAPEKYNSISSGWISDLLTLGNLFSLIIIKSVFEFEMEIGKHVVVIVGLRCPGCYRSKGNAKSKTQNTTNLHIPN